VGEKVPSTYALFDSVKRISYRVNEKVDGVHVPQLLPTVAATLAVTPDVVIV